MLPDPYICKRSSPPPKNLLESIVLVDCPLEVIQYLIADLRVAVLRTVNQVKINLYSCFIYFLFTLL